MCLGSVVHCIHYTVSTLVLKKLYCSTFSAVGKVQELTQ
jgi:hypothetical protein